MVTRESPQAWTAVVAPLEANSEYQADDSRAAVTVRDTTNDSWNLI